MKNSELLNTEPELLGSIDRQKRFLVSAFSYPLPCPNQGCGKPVNVFEAMGIDIDDYVFSGPNSSYNQHQKYECPHCHYKLRKIVPIFKLNEPGHHWVIDEPLPPKNK